MKEIILLIKGFLKRNKKHFLFPFLSIFIGVWGMIVVISVIKGFDKALIDSLTSFYPHIIVYDKVDKTIGNERFKMYFSTYQGFFNKSNKRISVSYWEMNDMGYYNKLLIKGNIDGSIIGSVMSKTLNLNPGDTINLFYTDDKNNIRLKRLKITGVFHSGIYFIDSSFIIKKETENFLNYTGIYLNNPKNAKKIKSKYLKEYISSTWEEQNENLAKAVEIDSYFALIITFFVVLMSGFSISNSVMYSIFVRKKEIGILYSMGMEKSKISIIFILESLIVAISGFFIGVFSSSITIFILKKIDLKLPSGIFYIDKIPFYLNINDIIISFIFIIILSFVFSFFSSRKLLSFDPVEVLHNE
ncbi:lipoprotein-releasing system permease protein [Marinitoga hydrogenitolerans DSM 16785]|uniref:Lipoprotein-releasing system permease protein n=1 Tax=Marinitoga hydrogenitolerans (strain DSM 16785 / JCM 12826 / AT1271) TaxID=1122195 RepID=A0A1M4X1I0_MARH1|nr:FtsX-like permease family protein [Marinitoga hydrogenitolerans]SHE87349.1 lipoprotein-releasing system permease protein [Marinitoga hydrogenitolerans DSM 16785]